MSLLRPAALLAARALRQFPRMPALLVFSLVPPTIQLVLFGSIFGNLTQLPGFPTDNYYAYLAPAIVLFTCVIGIANAGIALVNDFHTRYFHKLLVAPISPWSLLAGRLMADGVRVYVQGALMLILAMAFGAKIATGIVGALLLLLLATLFAVSTVGVIVTNVAIRAKDPQVVQAIFPVFFILLFLTTAFMPRASISSDAVKTLINWNPAEYLVRPMRGLMLEGFDWESIGVAGAIILGALVFGAVLTRLNYRTVYK